MSQHNHRGMWSLTALSLLAAGLLAVLPSSAAAPWRDTVRSGLAPLQKAALNALDQCRSKTRGWFSEELEGQRREISDLRSQLAEAELRERQAQLAAQRLSQAVEQWQSQGPSPFQKVGTAPLVTTQAVEARVLGKELLADWKNTRLLDRGTSDGVVLENWVLNSASPIVDAGADQSVFSGLSVFAGRCIVGRIEEAGRQASSLQLITDPEFRAKAVLASATSSGLHFGAEGLLEGTGEGQCRLSQVPTASPVRVGDAVYAPVSALVDVPMLFGRVISAERRPGALHWEITVKPQADLSQIRSVQIATGRLEQDRRLRPVSPASRPADARR